MKCQNNLVNMRGTELFICRGVQVFYSQAGKRPEEQSRWGQRSINLRRWNPAVIATLLAFQFGVGAQSPILRAADPAVEVTHGAPSAAEELEAGKRRAQATQSCMIIESPPCTAYSDLTQRCYSKHAAHAQRGLGPPDRPPAGTGVTRRTGQARAPVGWGGWEGTKNNEGVRVIAMVKPFLDVDSNKADTRLWGKIEAATRATALISFCD